MARSADLLPGDATGREARYREVLTVPDGTVGIVGMGVCNSIATCVSDYSRALRRGDSGVRRVHVPAADGHEPPIWIAADVRDFDIGDRLGACVAEASEIHVRALKTCRRAGLAVITSVASAIEAWCDAGLDAAEVDPDRIALVIAGQYSNGRIYQQGVEKFLTAPEHLSPRFALEYQETYTLGAISEVLGLRGEGLCVGGASASGNVAVIKGEQLLQLGLADVCVVCGISPVLSAMELQAFSNLGAMGGRGFPTRPEAASRPFDRRREGFIPGEGSACVVLERECSARARRAVPRAWVAGGSIRLSGESGAEPSVDVETRVMREAIERARMTPADIGYVNAHGSSSVVGDAVEVCALLEVFGRHGPPVNSTKSLIGHCLAAAGVQELVATVVQLSEGFRHASANLEEPMSGELDLLDRTTSDSARIALSNSFGFSGIHSSIVVASDP